MREVVIRLSILGSTIAKNAIAEVASRALTKACHSHCMIVTRRNFNDWMVGGDVLEGNLLANCVREVRQ